MAGILNAIYLILAVGVAIVGLGVLLQSVLQSDHGDSRWLEMASVVVAILFVLVLGIEFIV